MMAFICQKDVKGQYALGWASLVIDGSLQYECAVSISFLVRFTAFVTYEQQNSNNKNAQLKVSYCIFH